MKNFLLDKGLQKLLGVAIAALVVLFIVIILPVFLSSKANILQQEIFVTSGLFVLSAFYIFTRLIGRYNNKKIEFDEELKFENLQYFKQAIRELEITVRRYNYLGAFSFFCTLILVVILGSFVFYLFSTTIDDIQKLRAFNNTTQVTLSFIVLILRTSLLGTFLITLIYQSYKFTTSSFDQAVRFTKRKHASYFLCQVIGNEKENLKPENLEKIMQAFREWNGHIESAFTTQNLGNDDELYKIIDSVKKAVKIDGKKRVKNKSKGDDIT